MVEITGSGTITSDDGSFDGTFTYNAEGAMSAAVGFVETYAQMKSMPTAELVNGQRIIVTTTGRAGEFTVLLGNFSTEVSNDPEQGIWVPFNENSSGSTLVAKRDHGREVNLAWFGGVGDYTGDPNTATDNWAAIRGALGILSVEPQVGVAFLKPSKKLLIDDGNFYFSKPVAIRRAVWIEGAGQSLYGLIPTTLYFPPNKHGFITLRQDVDWDDTTESFFIPASQRDGSAQGTIIEGVSIKCEDPDAATRGEGDGVHVRSGTNLYNMQVAGFGGSGIFNDTNSISNDPADIGENNNFHWVNVLSESNEHGIFVKGADSSAGLGDRIDVRHNRQWGILDWSFLGNTWVAPHANGNGRVMDITAMVDDGTDVAITTSTAHELAVNDEVTLKGYTGAKGVDYGLYSVSEVVSTTQFKIINQSVGDAYVSGGEVGYGGSYSTRDINSRSVFLGSYAEEGQGAPYFVNRTEVLGGLLPDGVIGGFYRVSGGSFQNGLSVEEPQSNIAVLLGNTSNKSALRMSGPGQDIFGTQLKWFDEIGDGGSWVFVDGNGHDRVFGFTTDVSGFTFGRASAVAGVPFTDSMWIGGFGNNARCHKGGTAAPTSGEWAQGDIIYNREPSPGGKLGWVCTTGGVAGVDAVFKPFGAIDA